MKRGHNRLEELFANQDNLPSKVEMIKWDNEINAIFQNKSRHTYLARNIWLLMVMNEMNCIKQLAEAVGYDAAYVSKILSGKLKVQSYAVAFYAIAKKLKIDLDTLLTIDLGSSIEEKMQKLDKPKHCETA